MFREQMIVDESLTVDGTGYSLRVRLPWYRALPLSCIDSLTVSVDGEAAPASAVTLELDGTALTLDEATRAVDQVWFVLDDLVVRVSGGRLAASGAHSVELSLALRIPYIPVGGAPLTLTEHATTTMPAKELAP
jgi:Domain of unknown function (DUF6379)